MRVGPRLVLGSGFALIALGIGALFWSHALASGPQAAASGWWQGTLQALGVGLAVGGLVDVLAISGLNRIISAEDRRQQRLNARLREILNSPGRYKSRELWEAAVDDFAWKNGGTVKDWDPDVNAALVASGAPQRLASRLVRELEASADRQTGGETP